MQTNNTPKSAIAYKGTYYFATEAIALEYAKEAGWPTDRILKYGRGYAIQAGPSGNFAGPDTSPKPWRGYVVANHPNN